jgi:SAM-dependent methyltransferase
MKKFYRSCFSILMTALLSAAASAQINSPARVPDVPYVPTPPEVVEAMLKAANVTKNDVLYDLGSGDGRIVITAAKKYGTRGVGIDINPALVAEAKANAEKEKVADKVKFIEGDIFEQDFSEATVVTLYLLPDVNMKLRPTILKLKPGTRIVSHAFNMGDWKPDQTIDVDGRTVYFWRVPGPVEVKKP